MVSLQLVVLCGALTQVISDREVINLSQNLISVDPKLLGLVPVTESCTVNYSCYNCTAVRICAPTDDGQGLKETHRFNCPVGHWCDPLSAICIPQQPQSCKVPADFPCMRDGYYPDLNECSNYFYCHGSYAYVLKCTAPNRFYNPATGTCTPGNYCANKAICDKKNGIKVKISANDKQLFAYCSNGVVSTIDRCIGAYVFNEKTQLCEKACPHAGLFPSAEDCRSFYQCDPTFKTSSVYNLTELTCPTGEAFLESAYQCVNRTLVPNCSKKLPSMYSR